jgi:hypothetical protein
MPHQNEVHATKASRVFNRHDVSRRLDNAELCIVSTARGTNGAQFVFGKHPASTAMPDTTHCIG